MWNLLIGPAIQAVSGYFKDKATIKAAKVKGQVEVIQIAAKNSAEWTMLMAKGAMSSWKDEYVLILLSVPYILSFVPGGAEYATDGFAALATMPEWYTYSFMTICLASYGIKFSDVLRNKTKLK
jgi:hypothetical protein